MKRSNPEMSIDLRWLAIVYQEYNLIFIEGDISVLLRKQEDQEKQRHSMIIVEIDYLNIKKRTIQQR